MTATADDSLTNYKHKLDLITQSTRESLSLTHQARERGLKVSREIIRASANSIRATHRGEFSKANLLLKTVREFIQEFESLHRDHPSVYYAGFVEDALKEYMEANATLAFAQQNDLPTPDEIGIGAAPYLNGLAEAVGELRRFILDSLRRDDFSRCEELLQIMDDVYTLLVSIDFPEAVTRGLRRNTDMVRGVLERTRGDLTLALMHRRLEKRIVGINTFNK